MSWEQPPARASSRRFVLPVVAILAVIAVAAVAVTALRSRPAATLSVGPTPPPADTAADVDPADFAQERLPTVATTTEEPGSGPLLPGAGELTVIAADDSGLQVLDVATGDLERFELPRPGRSSLSGTLFTVGRNVVIDLDADVVVVPERGRRPVRIAADHRAIPTVDDDAVWVFDNFAPYARGTASQVTTDGDVLSHIDLPAVAVPLVGTDDGLVVSVPGAISVATGDGERRLVARGMAVATDGERLAWLECQDDLSCAVNLGTVDDPDQVRSELDTAVLPAGFYGLPTGTFSPDGRYLALPLYRSRNSRGLEDVAVSVIDTTTGAEAFHAEGSTITPFETPLAWSPDGRWLVFVSGGDVRAWDATSGETTTLRADLRSVRALAVR